MSKLATKKTTSVVQATKNSTTNKLNVSSKQKDGATTIVTLEQQSSLYPITTVVTMAPNRNDVHYSLDKNNLNLLVDMKQNRTGNDHNIDHCTDDDNPLSSSAINISNSDAKSKRRSSFFKCCYKYTSSKWWWINDGDNRNSGTGSDGCGSNDLGNV